MLFLMELKTVHFISNIYILRSKVGKKITIIWSDFGINILCIQKNHNINNIYERITKEYISLESYLK